jgi:HEPN domain-containing protein
LQAIEAHTSVTDSLRMACARLNRYYIPTRYPDAFDRGAPADQFFAADAHQAVADAEEVIGFATGIIGSS